MLSKALLRAKVEPIGSRLSIMGRFTQRGAYLPGKEPAVFINKDTKVICQGMTGKQVSDSSYWIKGFNYNNYRAHSTLNKQLSMERRWLEVWTSKNVALSILDFPYLRMLLKLKNTLNAMPVSFTYHLHKQLRLSKKQYKLKLNWL